MVILNKHKFILNSYFLLEVKYEEIFGINFVINEFMCSN